MTFTTLEAARGKRLSPLAGSLDRRATASLFHSTMHGPQTNNPVAEMGVRPRSAGDGDLVRLYRILSIADELNDECTAREIDAIATRTLRRLWGHTR